MDQLKLRGKQKAETTNLDLIKLAKLNDIQLDAIVFKDHLTELPASAKYIIMNMSNSGHAGTHWVAIAVLDSAVLYSDSFGVVPPQAIIEFCQDRKIKNLYYNTIEIQHINSGGCGSYSLYFLKEVQQIFN
jgi:hypothetical protein